MNQQTGIYGTACVDKQKNLWIATEGYGLLQYEISTGEGNFYLIDKESYSAVSYTHLYLSLSEQPKQFLKEVPAAWDESILLAGYPADYAVVALSLIHI